MIPRYQRFTQRLNNIQKVCIVSNMLVDGLSLVRAPAATLAWRRKSVLDSGSDYSVN
jgi:hypothetical protein